MWQLRIFSSIFKIEHRFALCFILHGFQPLPIFWSDIMTHWSAKNEKHFFVVHVNFFYLRRYRATRQIFIRNATQASDKKQIQERTKKCYVRNSLKLPVVSVESSDGKNWNYSNKSRFFNVLNFVQMLSYRETSLTCDITTKVRNHHIVLLHVKQGKISERRKSFE